jgi:hypothetical protein
MFSPAIGHDPARSEVLRAVSMTMMTFRAVISCGLEGKYERFGEIQCLHLQT